jgi:hypothetical protein
MKSISFLPLVLLLFSCSIQDSTNENDSTKNLTGEWQDVNGAAFDHCTANFYNQGDSVFFNHFLTWNSQPFFEKGSGIRKGDSILYHVDVLHGIEGWSTAGDHALKLSQNGDTLTGSYSDNKGNQGALKFIRVRTQSLSL